jgi:raffinose/stachyose/melibiose transport system permease protein
MDDDGLSFKTSSPPNLGRRPPAALFALYAPLVLLAVVQVFPLIWLVDFSLNKSGDLFGESILKWPDPPQFRNYAIAWTDGNIPRFFFNSMVVNVSTIIITISCVLPMSYAFVRMDWKLKGFFYTVILTGLMIPIHVTILPNYFIFNAVGIKDSYLSLILPYVAFSLPLGVLVMSGFLESVPRSLEESAVMDGCSIRRIVFRIILPLTKPAVVTITIMTFMGSWNEFIMAATFLSSNLYRTLPFAVYNFAGVYSSEYAIQFAVMTLTALPALVIYIALNGQITKGITVGAVKG